MCSVTDIVVVLIEPTREWLFVEWTSSVGGRVVVAVEPQLYQRGDDQPNSQTITRCWGVDVV